MERQTTFRFPTSAAARLETIRRLSRQSESATVLQTALRLYEDLVDLAQTNFDVLIRDQSGKDWPYSPYEPFEYPGLSAARSQQNPDAKMRAKDFVISAAAVARIDQIRPKAALKDRTDVVRAALASYHELLLVSAYRSDKIVVRSPSGDELPVTLDEPLSDQVALFENSPPRGASRANREFGQPRPGARS